MRVAPAVPEGHRQGDPLFSNAMAKEVVISTSGVNSYGCRVLTEGIDLRQYQRNPILLWMHRRSFDGDSMPIGRIENLRIDGDRLIGTPVFDQKDEFAKKIESKWEDGFLRMASAGIEVVEVSNAPEYVQPGQTRATIIRCKLEEVSIVDIGANDEALQLSHGGKVLRLAAGEQSDIIPLLAPKEKEETAEGTAPEASDNNQIKNQMNKEFLQLLGLSETATEQEALGALRLMKEKADKVESLQLASITALVDGAIAEKRITADKKDHFVSLGKSAGIESLRATLELMQPQHKPTDILHQRTEAPAGDGHKTYVKLSEVPEEEIRKMKEENPVEYARLYKAEYGVAI